MRTLIVKKLISLSKMESTSFKLLILADIFHQQQSSSTTNLSNKEALPTKSGYLKDNSATGSAIFYAFYEAQNTKTTSLSDFPLVIWLQGGPGCSSITRNFYELGPWQVTPYVKQNNENMTLEIGQPSPHPNFV